MSLAKNIPKDLAELLLTIAADIPAKDAHRSRFESSLGTANAFSSSM
jgi:hypothetical protein